MTNFTPGAANPSHAALERLQTQLAIATNVIIQALAEVRGYTLDSFLPDHAADLLAELLEMDSTTLTIIIDADDPVGAANMQLDRLPTNALYPADGLKMIPRYVLREFLTDRASADSSVDFSGPGELRRSTREIADKLGIDLFAIEPTAREIGAREARIKAEIARHAEEARIARVKAKGRAAADPAPAPRRRQKPRSIFG